MVDDALRAARGGLTEDERERRDAADGEKWCSLSTG
jgi:hypothetical protein